MTTTAGLRRFVEKATTNELSRKCMKGVEAMMISLVGLENIQAMIAFSVKAMRMIAM